VGRSALYQHRSWVLSEADLLTAQRRLHYFAAVLLLEQPGSSMEFMASRFGWREVGWREHRAGSRHGSDAAAELSPEQLRLLEERNKFDLRLYQYAQALHAAQVAAARVG